MAKVNQFGDFILIHSFYLTIKLDTLYIYNEQQKQIRNLKNYIIIWYML